MRDIGNIIKVEDLNELGCKAAEIIIYEGQRAIEQNGKYMLALSGGRTPQPIYKLLSSVEYINQLDWTKVFVFFTDERCVPSDHPDSNYGMVKKLLLDYVPVKYVFGMYNGVENPREAALAYNGTIKDVFNLNTNGTPKFDLMLLGLGEDGHVVSIFPGFENIEISNELVVAPFVEKLRSHRISLTFNVINQSKKNLFIISGSKKKNIFYSLSNTDDSKYPIAQINFNRTNSTWILA